MSWCSMLLNPEWKLVSSTARQRRAEQLRAVPDRREPTRGVSDNVPPLPMRIAASFWCQPPVRATGGQPSEGRDTPLSEGNLNAG